MSATKPHTVAPLVSLLLCFAVPSSCLGADSEDPTPAVAQVLTERGAGSGTLIVRGRERGWLLTAAHVIAGGAQVRVVWQTGVQQPARVLAADRQLDVALLEVSQPPAVEPIPLASDDEWPRQGDAIELVGYGGGRLRHWRAKVNGYALTRGVGRYQTLSVATQTIGGDSGGAMIFRGKLVGVIWGGPLAGPRGPMLAAHGTCCVAINEFLRGRSPWSSAQAQFGFGGQPPCAGGRCPLPSRIPPSSITPPRIAPPPHNADELKKLAAAIARLQLEIAALKHMPPAAVDYGRIEDGILQHIAEDERFRGPPGQDGQPGRDGTPGRDAADVNLDRLADQIKQRISGSIRIRVEPVKSGERGAEK